MIKFGDIVIIRNYCGILVSAETDEWFSTRDAEHSMTITLRDRFDPRITITMEDVLCDEIQQNPVS